MGYQPMSSRSDVRPVLRPISTKRSALLFAIVEESLRSVLSWPEYRPTPRGTAATGETQLVEDVNAFPDHIACDSRSQSEIVVPVRDAQGRLIAVFDVDSDRAAAFDSLDAEWLERILAKTFGGVA